MLQTAKPDYEKVVFYCKEVLQSTPKNPKALFRMAQALFQLGDFEGALQSCNQIQSLESQLQEGMYLKYHPNESVSNKRFIFTDSKVVSLKTQCLAQLKHQSSNEKALYGKMFGFQQNKQN